MQRDPDRDRCNEIRAQLEDCIQSYRLQRQLTHHLERDVELTMRLLSRLETGP